MKAKNIKEAEELIERYETITLEEIKEEVLKWQGSMGIATEELTGFGCTSSCTLCQSVSDDCYYCIYGSNGGCFEDENTETYNRICEADTPDELLAAYRARAKHIRSILNS